MDIKVVLCSRIWIKSGHMFTYGSNLVICPKMDVNLVKGPKTCQLGRDDFNLTFMIFFGELPYDVGYQKKHIRPHGGG